MAATDKELLAHLTAKPWVESCKYADEAVTGGLTADMRKVLVQVKTGVPDTPIPCPTSIIRKRMPEAKLPLSKSIGCAREALFYQQFASQFPAGYLANIFYSHGDMLTGEKVILMQDLTLDGGVQAGYAFGGGSPLNWGKDMAGLSQPLKDMLQPGGAKKNEGQLNLAYEVSHLAFQAAALFHFRFWNDAGLMDHPWLKASDWRQGKAQDSFLAAQAMAQEGLQRILATVAEDEAAAANGEGEGGKQQLVWDARVLEVLKASVAKISWETFQTQVKDRAKYPFTLAHGDYQPANMMVMPAGTGAGSGGKGKDSPVALILIDWEVVGLGSGPQDLGQFIISHMEPKARKEVEKKLMQDYYATLSALLATEEGKKKHEGGYTWEQCWREYQYGGLERWIWLLIYLVKLCPVKMSQYFHDQVLAFVVDHQIDPLQVGQPRV